MGMRIIIEGPRACGKTWLAGQIAHVLNVYTSYREITYHCTVPAERPRHLEVQIVELGPKGPTGAHNVTFTQIRPSINLNGQTAAVHIEDRRAAMDALKAAMDALSKLSPHGRDYPAAVDRLERDIAQHRTRYAVLNDLFNILQAEALQILRETNT